MLLIGVQIRRKFCVMFSTYCTSNFRRNAFSVITAYDRFYRSWLKESHIFTTATYVGRSNSWKSDLIFKFVVQDSLLPHPAVKKYRES